MGLAHTERTKLFRTARNILLKQLGTNFVIIDKTKQMRINLEFICVVTPDVKKNSDKDDVVIPLL